VLERTISSEEYARLQREGKVPPSPRPVTAEHLEALVKKVELLADAQGSSAQADKERSQVMLEILATLQAVARQKPTAAPTLDMSPLADVIAAQPSRLHNAAVPYTFDVERDGRGFIKRIHAAPAVDLNTNGERYVSPTSTSKAV